MLKSILSASTLAAALVAGVASSGCSVMRDQQSVGTYVDDTAITTAIKAKFVEDKAVDASSISVETLKGQVQLSGFAKNATEKARAADIARNVKGVVGVTNSIIVR